MCERRCGTRGLAVANEVGITLGLTKKIKFKAKVYNILKKSSTSLLNQGQILLTSASLELLFQVFFIGAITSTNMKEHGRGFHIFSIGKMTLLTP